MKPKQLLLIGLLLIVASCTNSSIYSEDKNFPDNQWHKNNASTFEFNIDDDTKPYDVIFSLSHVYGYQFDSIPLSFKWVQPDGTSETIPLDLKIKDEKGNELGDCVGDICDLQHPLFSQKKFTKGKHRIIASHSFEYDYLPNIIHIGINVNSSK